MNIDDLKCCANCSHLGFEFDYMICCNNDSDVTVTNYCEVCNHWAWDKENFSDRSGVEIEEEIQPDKRDVWEEDYGDDCSYMTWEEFDENYIWCDECKSYQEGQCICYAR